MEISLANVDAGHGQTVSMTGIALTSGSVKEFLTGINLLRPLGAALATLAPIPAPVVNANGTPIGSENHDGNLAVPGSVVNPIVNVVAAPGFNQGANFVELNLSRGVLSIDPVSPAPATVPHIPMDTALATVVAPGWNITDGQGFQVDLPAFSQDLALNLNKDDEGSLVVFTNLSGVAKIGIAVDITATGGGGATVIALQLTQVAGTL